MITLQSKAKKDLYRAGIEARRVNRDNRKARELLLRQGLPISPELEVIIRELDKNPTKDEKDSLLANPALQQEVLRLQNNHINSIPIDPLLLNGSANPTEDKSYYLDISEDDFEGENKALSIIDKGSKLALVN